MAGKKEVKVNKNIIFEFDDGNKLVIKLDEEGRHDGAYCIIDGKKVETTECKNFGGVRYLSNDSIAVTRINPYCACYRDFFGQLICYSYPPGQSC
jgi:hypothetical protein